MADNQFSSTVEALFKGMDNFVTTKTVVGEAVKIDDTIILPLVDVTCAMAAGAFSQPSKNNGAGGMSAKDEPQCDSRHSEWRHKVSQYQASGCRHKNHRYGS